MRFAKRVASVLTLGGLMAFGLVVMTGPVQHQELERRGCCSKHGGVCGCKDGRALCCDDTLSPSCGCD